jgi:hypothetical protein
MWSGARFKRNTSKGHYYELLKYYEGQASVATHDIEKVAGIAWI